MKWLQISSARRRIITNTAANLIGIGLVGVQQLASVPILLHSWGAEQFGAWLLLTTIPNYLVLGDMGFTQAATSAMTICLASGRYKEANVLFNTTWAAIAAASVIIMALSIALMTVVELSFPDTTWASHGLVMFILTGYACAILASQVSFAAFKASQRYAEGTLLLSVCTFVEGLSVPILALNGASFLLCAAFLLLFRLLTCVGLQFYLAFTHSRLRLRIHYASFLALRKLWRPALAALAIPTALALSLQGTVLSIGITMSAATVATFVTVRTASRLLIQVIGTANRASMPEISVARARNHHQTFTRIVFLNFAIVLLWLAPGMFAFGYFGVPLIELWTNGHVTPDATFVAIMALAGFTHASWYFLSNIFLSTNSHTPLAVTLLLASVGAVVFSLPAGQFGGLNGVASVLLTSEAVCLARALYLAVQLRMITF